MNKKSSEAESLKKFILKSDDFYLKYHANRYKQLINFIAENYSAQKKVLDIGNSTFAQIVSQIFQCQVDELGFSKDSKKPFGHQYQFNLNDCHDESKWRTDIGKYDLIIFAEVIEHLYTSPVQVLSYLHSILQEKGKIILQTPNATVLHKRIQLLLGKNPYMLIRENVFNPGHFREYTKAELIEYANTCDLL